MGAQVICLSGIIFHENTRVGFREFYLPTQFPYLMMVTLIGLVGKDLLNLGQLLFVNHHSLVGKSSCTIQPVFYFAKKKKKIS